MIWSVPVAAFGASALLGLTVCALLWGRRAIPGALPLFWAMAAATWWAATAGLEAAAVAAPAKVLLSQFSYLGIAPLPVCYLVFALRYARPDRHLQRSALAALALVPAATVLAAFTNGAHGWLWVGFSPDPDRNLLIYRHGPAFYLFVAYAYLLVVVVAAVLTMTAVRGARFYGSQAIVLIASSLAPVLFNVLYVVGRSPVPGLDLAPTVFSASGLLLSLGLYRYGLFRIVPVGRDLVVDQLDDGVVVVGADGAVADANARAWELLGGAESARERVEGEARAWAAAGAANVERAWQVDGRDLEVRLSPITAPTGLRVGGTVLVRDVTERLRIERELAETRRSLAERVAELEATLQQVSRLETLLPICAYCKKVRDDRDYWREVDDYLTQQTGARLTHGICPECTERVLRDL